MPLGQWISNAPLEHDDFLPLGEHDYLGLIWDTRSDSLRVKLPDLILKAREDPSLFRTKRKIVSLFSSVFDPLGFLSPLSVAGKLLIQRLWREKLDWDARIPDSMTDDLIAAIRCFDDMEKVSFPRNAHSGGPHTLHVFCDASRKAFGVVAYAVVSPGQAH